MTPFLGDIDNLITRTHLTLLIASFTFCRGIPFSTACSWARNDVYRGIPRRYQITLSTPRLTAVISASRHSGTHASQYAIATHVCNQRYNGSKRPLLSFISTPSYNEIANKKVFPLESKMSSEKSFSVPSSSEVQAGTIGKPTAVSGIKYWAKRLTVETGGIERITDADRAENTSKVWNACTFW